MVELKELVGKTVTKIKNEDNEKLIFTCSDGSKYKLYHSQDCCEIVSIDDINGDLEDLIGSKIVMAEEVNNNEFVEAFDSSFVKKEGEYSKIDQKGNYEPDSCTWTFYKFATIKGYVNIRWYGESNGCYSEGVDFAKADDEGNFSRW